MNTEKLKEHGCRFCKYYDEYNCSIPDDRCSYMYYNEECPDDIPFAWQLHPDISEAMQPDTTELEKILCAAIWYKELPIEIDARGFQPVNTDIGIVVTGYRHGNCIATVKELSGLRSVKLAPDGVGELKQGFLTNKNRFVDRQEAMIIARKANQLINEDHTDTLFSEDLY